MMLFHMLDLWSIAWIHHIVSDLGVEIPLKEIIGNSSLISNHKSGHIVEYQKELLACIIYKLIAPSGIQQFTDGVLVTGMLMLLEHSATKTWYWWLNRKTGVIKNCRCTVSLFVSTPTFSVILCVWYMCNTNMKPAVLL